MKPETKENIRTIKIETKNQYLKKVQEIGNEEMRILNHHLSRCFQRFAERIFKLNKKFIEEEK